MKKKRYLILLLTLLVSITTFAQKSTYKGVVVDNHGDPIIGASVVQKGTSTGTVTDLDGNFSVSTDAGSILSISYIGYKTKEIKVSSNMKITLDENAASLNEVVVVGYGVQKKSVVTASIAKVGADELGKTQPVRIDGALKGLVSGVQVTTGGGQPGASSKIRIRGNGTINNSDPLYIVDGMPIDGGIDYLNPSDIESIEILKDAASGAVYGARAANGVVLVTTKTGKLGKVKVKYDVSFGWQNPWRKRNMMDADDYSTLMKEAAGYAGDNSIDAKLASFGTSNTNWQKELFNDNAPVQNHQISLSGASENLDYFLSLGYYKQEGTIGGNYDRSNYDRLSIRSNTNYRVFDVSKDRNWLHKMKVGVNVAYSRINSTSIETNNLTGSALGNALFLSPLMSVYPENEDALRSTYTGEVSKYGPLVNDKNSGRLLNIPTNDFNEITNPLAYLSLPGTKSNSDKFVANFYAELNLWDALKFRTSYGVDLSFWGDDGYSYPYYIGVNAHNDKSSVYSSMNRGCRWQVENVLSYDKTFGKHSISVVLGQSAIKYTGRKIGGSAEDMIEIDGDKANLDFTTGLKTDGKRDVYGGLFDPHTLASYFGRFSYNYAERYMLQMTMRRDGSSNFGPNHKWGTFPSVSLGWNVTNENFMADRPSWFTNMKIRLSWGKNGNENIGAFRYTANVAMGNNYAFGDGSNQTVVKGSKPTGTPNEDLKWEESEQYDAGIDFGFLNNSLTFTVDWFKKKTNGMLKEMSIPSYLGESKPWGNVGDMQNSGIEFEASYKFNLGEFKFNTSGNISYLKNKLIKLGNAAGFETYDNVHQIGNVSRAENGQPYPYFYGYKTAGIFQNMDQVNNYVNSKGQKMQPNAQPGDVIFVDYNNDGVIDDNDKTKIGKGDPDWTYGVTINASWRNFDLSMLWAGSIGNKIFDATRRLDLRYVNLPQEYMDRWHGEGTSNSMPRFTWKNDNDNYRVSDLYIKNGSYLRLKNIQLGYTLPQSITEHVFISNLRLYVAAENLLTLTGYKGMEPEIFYGTQSGIDRGYYPQNRTITIGANITF
ncbi:SusC/RagA family TonB-linked outer membrane protein [Xylanibacter oryzae]|uniref:SusC/RagA family TonB-linked outer membrane protein n=1 Tax=Xylanibacter oryzae TaxID=185293 RepID=UPI0004B44A32|nr:TonB-dependent receptor [Xylanibacter oryzae]